MCFVIMVESKEVRKRHRLRGWLPFVLHNPSSSLRQTDGRAGNSNENSPPQYGAQAEDGGLHEHHVEQGGSGD